MKARRVLALFVLIQFLPPVAALTGELKVTRIADSTVDPKALVIRGGYGMAINGMSFQQDAVVTEAGWQYVAYYDAARHVCVARRKVPDGKWEVVRLTDYKTRTNDAHNVISMGICPKDGTIHLSFDHHNHVLRYRMSAKGVASEPEKIAWKVEIFGKVYNWLPGGPRRRIGGVCYPRFLKTPQGALQFFWRSGISGRGDSFTVNYNPETGTCSNRRHLMSSKGTYDPGTKARKYADRYRVDRCPYFNGFDYGPDGKLHTTWVWREHWDWANRDLMHAYSEDGGKSWQNNQGELLRLPIDVKSPGIRVAEISEYHGLMNQHGQTVDSKGRVHTVMWHCTAESLKAAGSKPGADVFGPVKARRYHHYWRDTKGKWHHTEIDGVATGRPKVFADKDDNLFVIYTEYFGRGSDGYKGITGRLVIMAATATSQWKDWTKLHVEKGPFVNEMIGDPYRWKSEGILSVLVQDSPARPPKPEPTALRILDFKMAQ
jgi:hypothetical protein